MQNRACFWLVAVAAIALGDAARAAEELPVPAAQPATAPIQATARVGAADHDTSRALLAEKIKALEALQAEVDALRKKVGDETQFVIHFKLVEIQRAKLRELGFDFILAKTQVVDAAGFSGMIRALVNERAARVICEPTVTTTNGRPAMCHVGSEVFVSGREDAGAPVKIVMQVDLVARSLGAGLALLDTRFRHAAQIESTQSPALGDASVLALRVCQVDTCLKVQLGKMYVLSVDAQREYAGQQGKSEACQSRGNDIETILLITVNGIDEPPANNNAPPQTTLP